MKSFLYATLCTSALIVGSVTAQTTQQNDKTENKSDKKVESKEEKKAWKLIWSDEFNKPKLDETKWTRVKRSPADCYNMMSEREDLLELKEGILKLKGIVNTDEKTKKNQPYLTAGLTGKGKFDFTYGKVEIRARFQSAKGAWPALWMLRTGHGFGRPGYGEIDIMEHLNFDNVAYQTIHTYYTLSINKQDTLQRFVKAPIERDRWNTYGIIWDENKVTFTLNGKPTFSYPKDEKKGPSQYPFVSPYYFLLTMQIEGKWVGQPDPKDYPAFMEIDYIRVYQDADKK